MLTGRPPFLGQTAMEVMVAHARDPVTPPSQIRADIPADLEARRAPLPRQEPGRPLSGYAEPRPSSRCAAPTPRTGRPSHAARLVADHDELARVRYAPTRSNSSPEHVAITQDSAESLDTTEHVSLPSVPRIDVTPNPSMQADASRCNSTADVPSRLTTSSRSWMTEPIVATVHLAFAFDIGDEIDLDRARLILQGEPGQLPRRRRTPESIGYRPAPIRVELEPAGIELPGELVVYPAAARRADALRLRRDLAGRAVPRERRPPPTCSSWPAGWPSRPR